jgi:hypothetical protein
MSMPETPMHEDDRTPRTEDDIGAAWKLAIMKSKAVAKFVKEAPDDHLGSGIPTADASHQSATLFRAHDICVRLGFAEPHGGRHARTAIQSPAQLDLPHLCGCQGARNLLVSDLSIKGQQRRPRR